MRRGSESIRTSRLPRKMMLEEQKKTTSHSEEQLTRLAELYRGVSILLWSVPLYLIFSVQTLFTSEWKVFYSSYWDLIGTLPATAAAVCAVYGINLMRSSQQNSNKLTKNLEEFFVLLIVMVGLSPFFLLVFSDAGVTSLCGDGFYFDTGFALLSDGSLTCDLSYCSTLGEPFFKG